jgi:putative nucleotidyltransferase with HDIG domain
MLFASNTGNKRFIYRDRIIRWVILLSTTLLSFGALIFPYSLRQSSFPLKVGDVVPQDIQAPYAASYDSSVLTDQAKKSAVNAVAQVFLPVDPAITRKQIEKLRVAIGFISNTRLDSFASQSQKLSDLAQMADIQVSTEIGEKILALSDSRWQIVQQEALNVLEQVMRNTIREGQVWSAQRNVPTLISFSIPQDLAVIISELTVPFIIPNSLYSPDQTEAARQEALNSVQPVVKAYASGEIIVRRGQIITDAQLEAMQYYGLIQNQGITQNVLASAALAILIGALTGLYFYRRKLSGFNQLTKLIIVALYFLLFLFGARFILPNRTILPYLFPISAFGLTIGSLFSMEIGLVFSIFLGILAGYGMQNGLDLTLFYILSSLFGIFVLGKGRRIINFFWAGIAVGIAGSAVILSYRLVDSYTDAIGITTLIGAVFVNGLASASLTLLSQYIFAQIMGMTTALQLLDLSRPDHPLLQFLLRNAPGSYQHSLLVANLAEQAAEAINADSLLVRVGCLYHDVGKALNPFFFIENQIPGKLDSHDDVDPTVSSATIISHVTNGVDLARKYRIPSRIQDFIREHHGTMITRYQYAKALEKANDDKEAVKQEMFRYPGPRPQSRETVLLMLADGCEAKARADIPKTDDELRNVVGKVVDYLRSEGQFDETALTLRDLHLVTESFVSTLRNTYHPRIAYPEIRLGSSNSLTEPLSLPALQSKTETFANDQDITQ